MKSNVKAHKKERDPYKTLLKIAGILAGLVVVSLVIFLWCNTAVKNDYKAKRQEVDQINADGEQTFNANMNALRQSNNATIDPDTGEITEVEMPYWEVALEGVPWRMEDESNTALENIRTETVDRATLMTGGLLLVNPWHSLPSDFSEDGLVGIGNSSGWKIAVADNTVKVFPAAYSALESAVAAATEAGLTNYYVKEAYRSNETQTAYFNSRMEKLSSKYSGDILIEQTKKYVNYPGTSEYQSGLAFHMGLYSKTDATLKNLNFQTTDQGIWFTDHCWQYGIIFRFPTEDYPNSSWEDKSYKTGVTMHLDLYRYVGKAHSAAMKIMDYCLEEYIEFLIDHPHLCIYKDGALQYEIYRIAAADAPSYDLPVPNPAGGYIATLDNMGGVVLAYDYTK